MIFYLPKGQELFSEELGPYRSFGIAAYRAALPVRRLAFVPDVSPSWLQAARLSAHCTLGRLEPAQLQEVAEDFVAALSTSPP